MIPIAKPVLDAAEADAARDAIFSGWVTQGPHVAHFERVFATYVRAPYACAVSSCTTALHLALMGVGVVPGDEVITVSHSFIATANAIRYCGATPVFVDIEPTTYNIDPRHVANAITPRTRAILAVHQMGMPCDMAAILAIAERHRISVVEDAACAAGSMIRIGDEWQIVGRPHGTVGCFSFHPRKVITTGDGGMLTTADPHMDQKFRLLRQHGMSVSDNARHGSQEVIFENYPVLGYNYRMTDIQGGIGVKQVERLPSLVARRRDLATRYRELLGNIEELRLPFEPEWARSNWQSYCVRLPPRLEQRAVMQGMLNRGVSTRRGIMCSHREASYADVKNSHDLRQSELAQDHSILLPLYPQMTEEEQMQVAAALREELHK